MITRDEEDEVGALPLTDCSFQILIGQYEAEKAAARAVAASADVVGNRNVEELAEVARCMEELSNDAKRLYKKLQSSGGVPSWLPSDVETLRMLGFDVRSITSGVNKHANRVDRSVYAGTRRPHPPENNMDLLLLTEQRVLACQQRADALSRENTALREALEVERSRSRPDFRVVEELASSVRALKEVYLRKRDRLAIVQEMREKFAVALRAIRAEDRRLAEAARDSDLPYSVVEDVFNIIRRTDAGRRVQYGLGPSCRDTSPVDTAVIRLLHDLDFPFPVSIRRVGPGGDYFIDRRVRIKIAEGQLLVRPVTTECPADSKPRYEHLAKYLIHLYAPAIDLDKFDGAAHRYDDPIDENITERVRVEGEEEEEEDMEEEGEEEEEEEEENVRMTDHSATTGVDDRLGRLLRQQQALRRSLDVQSAELQWHQQQLEAGLSPSPANQQEQSTDIKSSNDGADKVTRFLHVLESNGPTPDFSTLSESELRELRRATLRKQLRTLNGHRELLSPPPTRQSR